MELHTVEEPLGAVAITLRQVRTLSSKSRDYRERAVASQRCESRLNTRREQVRSATTIKVEKLQGNALERTCERDVVHSRGVCVVLLLCREAVCLDRR